MSIQILRERLRRVRKLGLGIATGVTPDEITAALTEIVELEAQLALAKKKWEKWKARATQLEAQLAKANAVTEGEQQCRHSEK